MLDDTPFEERRFIVQEPDGKYLKRIESNYSSATCPLHFIWTKHRHLAAEFTGEELHDRHAAVSLMQQLIHGYSGLKTIRVDGNPQFWIGDDDDGGDDGWKPVDMPLTAAETALVEKVGRSRYQFHRRRGHVSHFKNSEARDIRGCAGECAAAKYFGVSWDTRLGVYDKEGDIVLPSGRKAEVRASYRTGWVLCWHPPKLRPYIFTIAEELPPTHVLLLGWLEGALVKTVGIKQEADAVYAYACWRIREEKLNPLTTLS